MTWTTYPAAGGIVEREGRLLLVRQRRAYGTFWEIPSGYCEAGESFEEAAAREVLEEAGIAVEIGELVCTLTWERTSDRRRNVLVFFSATATDPAQDPRPQIEEDIDAAAYLDPAELEGALHPLDVALLERWRAAGATGFHFHANVSVLPDGTQRFTIRPDAS